MLEYPLSSVTSVIKMIQNGQEFIKTIKNGENFLEHVISINNN